jgi:hypothetical protein
MRIPVTEKKRVEAVSKQAFDDGKLARAISDLQDMLQRRLVEYGTSKKRETPIGDYYERYPEFKTLENILGAMNQLEYFDDLKEHNGEEPGKELDEEAASDWIGSAKGASKKQAAKFPNLFSADTIKWIELETQLIAANNYGVPASIDQANAFIDKAKDEVVDIISKAVSGEVTRVINASKEDLLEAMMEDIEAAMQSAQQGGVPAAQPQAQPQAPAQVPQAPMSASLKKAFGEEKVDTISSENAKPELGSISEGTLRSEDLIPAFLDTLELYAPEVAQAIKKEYNYEVEDVEFDFKSENADYLLEKLFNALEEIAPEGSYFGANQGDGADFGFWSEEEELDEEAGGDWIGSANPVK